MKVLWVNTNFMHPTTKGGQIRTLEMLLHLHRWHEIHYVALENPALPEGPRGRTSIRRRPTRSATGFPNGPRPPFCGNWPPGRSPRFPWPWSASIRLA